MQLWSLRLCTEYVSEEIIANQLDGFLWGDEEQIHPWPCKKKKKVSFCISHTSLSN